MDTTDNNCRICEAATAKYLCPRCGLPYCSVQCYRNEAKHLDCSEAFYKKCVMENVKEHMQSNPEQANKMKEILGRFNQEYNDSDIHGGLENEDHDDLAELDSDDDEPLEIRMQGINLDDTDEVWKHLTEEEKADFKKLAAGTDAIDIIPEWIPWWTTEPKKSMIEELSAKGDSSQGKTEKRDLNPGQPAIISNIPIMNSLTKIRPNNHVKIGLSNVIAAYVWTSRIYAGEIVTNDRPADVAGAIITLSGFLATDTIFDTFESAITNVPMKACQDPILFDGGPTLHKQLQEDVLQILSSHNLKSPNSNKAYVLSALSDCFNVLVSAHSKPKASSQIKTASSSTNNATNISTNEENIIVAAESQIVGDSSLKNIGGQTFESAFPAPPPAFNIDSKLLAKAKRKLHYLLAFANEYNVL